MRAPVEAPNVRKADIDHGLHSTESVEYDAHLFVLDLVQRLLETVVDARSSEPAGRSARSANGPVQSLLHRTRCGLRRCGGLLCRVCLRDRLMIDWFDRLWLHLHALLRLGDLPIHAGLARYGAAVRGMRGARGGGGAGSRRGTRLRAAARGGRARLRAARGEIRIAETRTCRPTWREGGCLGT